MSDDSFDIKDKQWQAAHDLLLQYVILSELMEGNPQKVVLPDGTQFPYTTALKERAGLQTRAIFEIRRVVAEELSVNAEDQRVKLRAQDVYEAMVTALKEQGNTKPGRRPS